MKHTYHYCIEVSYYMWDYPRRYDGFLSLDKRITSQEEYTQIKYKLLEIHCKEPNHSMKVDVMSFGYLGAVEDNV